MATKRASFSKGESPSLVVLDVMLPGIDGLELCRWIRSRSHLAHARPMRAGAHRRIGAHLGREDTHGHNGSDNDPAEAWRHWKWMDGYCRKAADDLGCAVLCPGRLPRVLDIISCRGPAPAEELWGKYCFDYVLDSLFSGPPGYHGPFATNRRTGHLAVWTIGTKNDFYPDGLFACPSGGTTQRPRVRRGAFRLLVGLSRDRSGERQQRPYRLPKEHGRCRPGGQRPRHHGAKQEAVRELLFQSELVGSGPLAPSSSAAAPKASARATERGTNVAGPRNWA